MATISQKEMEQKAIKQWLNEKCIAWNLKSAFKSKTRRLQRKNDAKLNLIESQFADFQKSFEECLKKCLGTECTMVAEDEKVELEKKLENARERILELEREISKNPKLPELVQRGGNNTPENLEFFESDQLVKFAEDVMKIVGFKKEENSSISQRLESVKSQLKRIMGVLTRVQERMRSKDTSRDREKSVDALKSEAILPPLPTPSCSRSIAPLPVSTEIFPSPSSSVLEWENTEIRPTLGSSKVQIFSSSENELFSCLELDNRDNMTTEEIKFTCDFCHKKYRSKSQLNFHTKRCQQSKCQFCGQGFGAKEQHKTHACPTLLKQDNATFCNPSQPKHVDTMETEVIQDDSTGISLQEPNDSGLPPPSVHNDEEPPRDALDNPTRCDDHDNWDTFILGTSSPPPEDPIPLTQSLCTSQSISLEQTDNNSEKMDLDSDVKDIYIVSLQAPKNPAYIVVTENEEDVDVVDVEDLDSSNSSLNECHSPDGDDVRSSSSPLVLPTQPLIDRNRETPSATPVTCESCGERLESQEEHLCDKIALTTTNCGSATDVNYVEPEVEDALPTTSPALNDPVSSFHTDTPALLPNIPIPNPESPQSSKPEHGIDPDNQNNCVCGIPFAAAERLRTHIEMRNWK